MSSPKWDNAGTADVGAATWGNGTTGTSGPVTTANSLHGTTVDNRVGSNGVTALTNGNYVVQSPNWDNAGTINVGTATWGNGTTGITGAVTTANSLHGTAVGHSVGFAVTALTTGHYVVSSPLWDDGATADAGAATWGNGTTGLTGPVTTANSLHGTTGGDGVGSSGVTALTNGSYVVSSRSGTARLPMWGRRRGATAPPASPARSPPPTASTAPRPATRSVVVSSVPG